MDTNPLGIPVLRKCHQDIAIIVWLFLHDKQTCVYDLVHSSWNTMLVFVKPWHNPLTCINTNWIILKSLCCLNSEGLIYNTYWQTIFETVLLKTLIYVKLNWQVPIFPLSQVPVMETTIWLGDTWIYMYIIICFLLELISSSVSYSEIKLTYPDNEIWVVELWSIQRYPQWAWDHIDGREGSQCLHQWRTFLY